MKCPDCMGPLVQITLTGIDKTYRCFRCGGVWIRSSTADELPLGALEGWKPLKFDESILLAGDNRCPQDGVNLTNYEGEGIIKTWNVRRCERCRSWWFPTDTLFRLKAVSAEVGNYARVGRVMKLTGLVLASTVVGVVLGIGLTVGTGLVQLRQSVKVPAQGAAEFSATYTGGGVEVVTFKSEYNLEQIQMRPIGVGDWLGVKLDLANGRYLARITGLEEGKKYEIKIEKDIYIFETIKKVK